MSSARLRPAGETGYSLVEMIAVLMILGIIVGAITTLFVSGSKAELRMSARFEAQNTARLAMDKLRRDVHCASSSTTTGSALTLTFTQTQCLQSTPITSVEWCALAVSGSPSRFMLRRQVGATCSASSAPVADYLVSSSVFTREPASEANLEKVRANLQAQFPNMESALTLCDVLVLRNSVRSGADVDPAIECA